MLNYSWTYHCIGQIPFGHYHLMLSGLVDCVVLASEEIRESLVLREAKNCRLEKVQVGILGMERVKVSEIVRVWFFFFCGSICCFLGAYQLYTGVFVYLIFVLDRVRLQNWSLSPVICPVFKLPRSFRQQ